MRVVTLGRGGRGEEAVEKCSGRTLRHCVCDGEVQVLCKISVREHREYSCVALEGSRTALLCGC